MRAHAGRQRGGTCTLQRAAAPSRRNQAHHTETAQPNTPQASPCTPMHTHAHTHHSHHDRDDSSRPCSTSKDTNTRTKRRTRTQHTDTTRTPEEHALRPHTTQAHAPHMHHRRGRPQQRVDTPEENTTGRIHNHCERDQGIRTRSIWIYPEGTLLSPRGALHSSNRVQSHRRGLDKIASSPFQSTGSDLAYFLLPCVMWGTWTTDPLGTNNVFCHFFITFSLFSSLRGPALPRGPLRAVVRREPLRNIIQDIILHNDCGIFVKYFVVLQQYFIS